MANTGVKGRVVVAGTNDGISGLTVAAFDIDPLIGDDHLGTATTVDGNFHIQYQPGDYRPWFLGAAGENPDIEVRIYGAGGRLLLETPQKKNVTDDPLDLGTIEIHRNNLRVTDLRSATPAEQLQDPYWLATHTTLDPLNGDPIRLTRGNQLRWLVDGDPLFPEITRDVRNATTSVKLMNMAFDVETVATDFNFPGNDPETVAPTDVVTVHRLGPLLEQRADSGVAVHVLVWDLMDVGEFFNFLLNKLFSMDTADEVREFFQSSSVKTDTLESSQLLHMKMVVVDGVGAYVIGSTMKQGYFSDQKHRLRDGRHGGLLPAGRKEGRGLMHDVSFHLKGPAVRFVDQTFTTISNFGIVPSPPAVPAPQQPPIGGDDAEVALQVLRTLPGEMFTTSTPGPNTEHLPHGETGILESYQRAIMKAEEYLYIEDQYFVSQEVASAILKRMQENEALEVILLLNVKPDIGGYVEKQAALINELRDALGERKDRLGVFTMWRSDANRTPLEIAHIYVHSKLAIVDDRWASVGTANVDGASMNERQWGLILAGTLADLSPLTKALVTLLTPPLIAVLQLVPYAGFVLLGSSAVTAPSFAPFIFDTIRKEIARGTQHANPNRERQPPRHPEINVSVYNGIAGQPETGVVAELRNSLWTEHLGAPPPVTKPADGWLSVWRKAAQDHLTMLRNASAVPPVAVPTECKILEWVPERDHKEYLKALGIATQNIKVRGAGDAVPFVAVP